MRTLVLSAIFTGLMALNTTAIPPHLSKRDVGPVRAPKQRNIETLSRVMALPQDQLICNISRFGADGVNFLDTSYIRNHNPSTTTLGHQVGGGQCSRVSCDEGSAICTWKIPFSLPWIEDT